MAKQITLADAEAELLVGVVSDALEASEDTLSELPEEIAALADERTALLSRIGQLKMLLSSCKHASPRFLT